MNVFTTIVIATALALDAFAVSISTGIKLGCVTGRQTFRLAFHFGFFQFIMPVLGWLGGSAMAEIIGSFDHWVAMGLLGFIGGKMIHEALDETVNKDTAIDPTKGLYLISLSIATSIDALAVGLTLGVLHQSIWYPSIVIGLIAAGFTVLGMEIGSRIGIRFSKNMEITGGIVLIAIGVKIVLEHTIL